MVQNSVFLSTKLRNNKWLLNKLKEIWTSHFADVNPVNKVLIKFSRSSNYRFGSIRLDRETKTSIILINAKFRNREVPESVVIHTIAHELTHYAHGFSSAKSRLHQHPHRGGVVDKEIRKRGLGYLIPEYKIWLRSYLKTLKK